MSEPIVATVLALLLLGCRTSGGTRVEGGIGDDVCAVMLTIDATVVDVDGTPVGDAELWELNRIQPAKAYRLGITDSAGRLKSLNCYMPSLEFGFWHPDKEPVHLRFMIMRDGFGPEWLAVRPPAEDVLAAGNLLGVRPGEPLDLGEIKIDPTWRDKSYRVPFQVTLRRVAQ